MATYKVYKTTYSFQKLPLLSENEFIEMRKKLPFYPQPVDVSSMVIKKYWWYVIALFPPLFVGMIILPYLASGEVEPFVYASALKKKNRYFHEYYMLIYQSKDYQEYCTSYKKLVTL